MYKVHPVSHPCMFVVSMMPSVARLVRARTVREYAHAQSSKWVGSGQVGRELVGQVEIARWTFIHGRPSS